MVNTEYFKRDLKEYVTDLNPLKEYVRQVVSFISSYTGKNKKDSLAIAKKLIAGSNPNDPKVTYRGREENGDRRMMSCKLTEYIRDTVKSKDIMVPTLTVYDNPKKRKSLHAGFLAINVKDRSKHKKLAAKAYQNKDMDTYLHNDVLQKVKKIFNNSVSGSYASKSTILYLPSSHSTLTSTTRSIASIGNALTESIVAGNKGLYTPEHSINYIASIVSSIDMRRVGMTVKSFNLKVPTPKEVMSVLRYSSDRYWTSPTAHADIFSYLNKLDDTELSAVMYVNDLYHLRKYNNALITDFIGSLSKRVPVGCSNPLKILFRNVEGVNNLVHHICAEDIKGADIDYSELAKTNPELLMVLGSTADNIYRVLDKYVNLIKTFFVTDILPIDIASVRDCYRDVIVLSDTDSTCGSYDDWVNWYFGNTNYTPEAFALSAAVMTINTQAIDHNIKVFARNMNVDDSAMDLLKMKNEFGWSSFIAANVNKHYYADTLIREGAVFDKPKLELKGVHFISSAGNQGIVEAAHNEMEETLTRINNGEEISARDMIAKVVTMEKSILEIIKSGDISMYKLDKIKDLSAYAASDTPGKTPYFHHLLWSSVFADKYGVPGDPTYMTINIPTLLKTKRLLTEYIATIEDEEIRDKLTAILTEYDKTALGTFRIPLAIVRGSGVPKEILGAINSKRIVLNSLGVWYLFLETLGIYRKDGLLFCEYVQTPDNKL